MFVPKKMIFRKELMLNWLTDMGIDATPYLKDMDLIDGKVAVKSDWDDLVNDVLVYYVKTEDNRDIPVRIEWLEI